MNHNLTDVDIHLALSGSLPIWRRILLWVVCRLDNETRTRVRTQKQMNKQFVQNESPRLHQRISETLGEHHQESPGEKAHSIFDIRFFKHGWPSGIGVLATASLLMIVTWVFISNKGAQNGNAHYFAAKGTSVGMQLFVSGDSTYRVNDNVLTVGLSDTLQLLPVGGSPQYMVLLSWDAKKGVVHIFPNEGKFAGMISLETPPPALITDSTEENRLICITSTQPFLVSEAVDHVTKNPHLLRSRTKPFLEGELYFQPYTVIAKNTRKHN